MSRAQVLTVDGEQWVGVMEAAILVDRDPRSIRRWRASGWLRAHLVGRYAYVPVLDVMETDAALKSGDVPEVRSGV